MNCPLVSVIIPVYNVEPYLREALDSVLSQTYDNLEIILIDDGSTDGSGDICDEYALHDSHIRVIHQNNKGLSAARNAGLDVISGDYIVFLDSDDVYLPEYVSYLKEILVKEDADIVECKLKTFRNGESYANNESITDQSTEYRTFNRIEALHALVHDDISVVATNKLYKRKLWDDIRFPEGYVYEDNNSMYK